MGFMLRHWDYHKEGGNQSILRHYTNGYKKSLLSNPLMSYLPLDSGRGKTKKKNKKKRKKRK